jgi:hypothetical protein
MNNTAGINHPGTEEPERNLSQELWKASSRLPFVEIVAACEPKKKVKDCRLSDEEVLTVVVTTDLLLILTLRMHYHLRDEVKKDIFEQFGCKGHLGPIVTLLHNVQDVTW